MSIPPLLEAATFQTHNQRRQPRMRMPPQSGVPISETLPPAVRVHVLGAGPVGLAAAALLQSFDRFSVHLYEKRRDYIRTRMVQLAPYLVADSIASYCTDYIDGESVEAIFERRSSRRASRFGSPFRRPGAAVPPRRR
jgi:hypothetical protein